MDFGLQLWFWDDVRNLTSSLKKIPGQFILMLKYDLSLSMLLRSNYSVYKKTSRPHWLRSSGNGTVDSEITLTTYNETDQVRVWLAKLRQKDKEKHNQLGNKPIYEFYTFVIDSMKISDSY